MKIEHTTVMIDKSLDDAIMDLKRREKIKRTNDNFIAMLKGEKILYLLKRHKKQTLKWLKL
ncbi:hypothetical protein HID08_003941 [Escherichia coli]|nr:hypothetical protein [Escherichia coli]HDT5934372.1 hypothetical protein [Enterobacter kobei]